MIGNVIFSGIFRPRPAGLRNKTYIIYEWAASSGKKCIQTCVKIPQIPIILCLRKKKDLYLCSHTFCGIQFLLAENEGLDPTVWSWPSLSAHELIWAFTVRTFSLSWGSNAVTHKRSKWCNQTYWCTETQLQQVLAFTKLEQVLAFTKRLVYAYTSIQCMLSVDQVLLQ